MAVLVTAGGDPSALAVQKRTAVTRFSDLHGRLQFPCAEALGAPPYVPSVLPRCHLRSIWYRLYRKPPQLSVAQLAKSLSPESYWREPSDFLAYRPRDHFHPRLFVQSSNLDGDARSKRPKVIAQGRQQPEIEALQWARSFAPGGRYKRVNCCQ